MATMYERIMYTDISAMRKALERTADALEAQNKQNKWIDDKKFVNMESTREILKEIAHHLQNIKG